MAGVNFSELQTFGQLKELYYEDVQFQEHIQSSLKNFVKEAGSGEIEFDGSNFNVPLQLSVNESYGMINDDERLPEAGRHRGIFAKYAVKLGYASMELTTFAGTRGHKNGRSGGQFMDDYVKGTLLSFMANMDSDLYANGRGYRATVDSATPAASSFTVDFSTRMRPEMKLDWYDSTLTTKRGSIMVAIKGFDRMNRVVYVDSTFGSGAVPAGAAADDVLTVLGALDAGEPTDGRYVAGLARITDATVSLGQVNPATYAQWTPTNINASGANPSQELLQRHWDSIYVIGGAYPNRMAFNPAWKRAYLAQFLNQRRFTSNVFDTGAQSLTFSPLKMGSDEKNRKPGEFKMLEDKNADPTEIYIWHYDAFCTASDYADAPHIADEDGDEWRVKIGYDVLSAFTRYWWNTVTFKRNLIGRQYGFARPSGVI